jgi:hypothetical protein
MRRRRAQIALFEQLTGDFEETSKHGAEYHATYVRHSTWCSPPATATHLPKCSCARTRRLLQKRIARRRMSRDLSKAYPVAPTGSHYITATPHIIDTVGGETFPQRRWRRPLARALHLQHQSHSL